MIIHQFAAMFPVSDLIASLKYYQEVLGFREEFRFGNYAGIQRDVCRIHLSQQGNPNTGAPGSGVVYIFCDEVDDYFAEITRRGARVDGPPKDYPYGLRDFIARDPDDNQISFGTESRGQLVESDRSKA